MEKSDELSAKESLKLIESMIHKAQNRFTENGTLYLLWGWVVFICAIAHYFLGKIVGYKQAGAVWALTFLVIVYQIIFLSKKQKNVQVRTYTDEIIGYVWMTFGICMGLVTLIVSVKNAWPVMYPLVFLFYGIPTFLSGSIMRFTPLKIGGICCWMLSVLALYVHTTEIILLFIPAVLAGWIIPGYLLRARYKSA